MRQTKNKMSDSTTPQDIFDLFRANPEIVSRLEETANRRGEFDLPATLSCRGNSKDRCNSIVWSIIRSLKNADHPRPPTLLVDGTTSLDRRIIREWFQHLVDIYPAPAAKVEPTLVVEPAATSPPTEPVKEVAVHIKVAHLLLFMFLWWMKPGRRKILWRLFFLSMS